MHSSEARTSAPWRRRPGTLLVTALAGAVVLLGATAAQAGSVDATAARDTAVRSGTDASTADAPRARARTWPPTAESVGVPKGTTLSTYKGSCTITKSGKVIRNKILNCAPLTIKAKGVRVESSLINGFVMVGTQDGFDPVQVSDPEGDDPIRVTIIDSEIHTPADSDFRPISASHYVVKRSYLHGSFSGGECHNACTIKWSFVQGYGEHSSGLRILRNGTLKHNTIWCELNPDADEDNDGVPDVGGGCSGNLVMYEEFGMPHHNLLKHNYFPADPLYSSLKFNGADGGHIRVLDNVFGLPWDGKHVADDWDAKSSNTWSGNTFSDGRTALP